MEKFWFNGELVQGNRIELSITEPGLLYGATVFTTLRVYGSLDHPLTYWQGHCDRLSSTLQGFGWQLPDWNRVRQGAESLDDSVLRITIFPDGREWITGRSLPADLAQRQQHGITAWVADDPYLRSRRAICFSRSLPQHKTGNYLTPWLALQTAHRHQAQEAILIDADANWLETSTGTLWGWRDGQWWTPPLATGILPGLVRSRLISELKCQNKGVVEYPWSSELVPTFAAIAYTNCVVEVIPIHTVRWRDTDRRYDPQHSALENLRRGFTSPSPGSQNLSD